MQFTEISQSAMAQNLVEKVREEVFSPSADIYSLLPASAYDTAWVAMVPHPRHPGHPLFCNCLKWIINNQTDDGFWASDKQPELLSIESLTDTLACIIALSIWNTGSMNINLGIRYLQTNMERILKQNPSLPTWFTIVFPGLLELAQAKGLQISIPNACQELVDDIQKIRTQFLQEQEKSKNNFHCPMEMYLEVLPNDYKPSNDDIIALQSHDGSLFQSPSASAYAFMVTGNGKFLDYMKSLVTRCDKVPARYPVNKDDIKMCMVDHMKRMGCDVHFTEEIGEYMEKIYRNWCMQEQVSFSNEYDISHQISKDSLAFQLLRSNGYHVSPEKLCWFMNDAKILAHIEKNYIDFWGAIRSLYRATDYAFPEEIELQNARFFSKNILEKFLASSTCKSGNYSHGPNDLEEIRREVDIPWLSRMDHLEHRLYIERNNGYYSRIGKNSYFRIASSKWIHKLAVQTFTRRQSVYKEELMKLTRWSKDQGLANIGFGRENTMYCYFCSSTSVSLPIHSSDWRMVTAKCATLVTVADDFFDEKGSMEELEKLTKAVQRWEGANLSGHSQVIFQALVEVTHDVEVEYNRLYGLDVREIIRRMWSDAFNAWLEESKWSKVRAEPSTDEYLRVAKISVAIQAMTLPACLLSTPNFPDDVSSSFNYSNITELTMVLARLINDCQSYQKELENGKLNMVVLHMKENPKASIEDSIKHIKNIVAMKDKEFLKLFFSDNRFPYAWKLLHLATLKSFHMLYESTNLFDSTTALLRDINMAFNTPLELKKETNDMLESKPSYNSASGSSFDQLSGSKNSYLTKVKCKSEIINCRISRAKRITSNEFIKCHKSKRWDISMRPPPYMFCSRMNGAMTIRML